MLNEGFTEDAKAALRQILILQPTHVAARLKLREIHDLELKQIFQATASPPPAPRRFREDPAAPERINPRKVLEDLDHDFGLGVICEEDRDRVLRNELQLFGNEKDMEQFGERLDSTLAGVTARERIDIGVAFLEMGLFDIAIRSLKVAQREEEFQLSATALLAYAMILAGRPFDAAIELEAVVRDSEHLRESKVDLYYLLGRAYQALAKSREAARWYRQAAQIEPHYRDVDERLLTLER
jgi:tetratricopeptide (TPR) repeat protein